MKSKGVVRMPSQERLVEILEHMRSDSYREQMAAADDFIQEGYSTSILYDEVEKTQQPNLVSMLFFIAGKLSDEETEKAWNYLRQRFEATSIKFEIRSFRPENLSDINDSRLLFAANTYLVTEAKIHVFLRHLENIKDEAEKYIKNILSKIDMALDPPLQYPLKPDSDFNYSMTVHVRCSIEREFPQFEGIGEDDQNLSSQEIDLASQITALDIYSDCRMIQRVDTIPLLLYRQWLINFFYAGSLKFKCWDYLKGQTIEEKKENIIHYIGYYSSNLYRLMANINQPQYTRGKYTVENLIQALENMRNMVKNFSYDEYIAEAEKVSEYPNWNRYLEDPKSYAATPHKYPAQVQNGRPYFPDVPCPYDEAIKKLEAVSSKTEYGRLIWAISRGLLRDCDDKELRIDMLNRIEEIILLKYRGNQQAYEDALIATYIYFYFEQDIYHWGKGGNYFEELLKKNAAFYEPLFLPYLTRDAFLDIGSIRESRAYAAFEILISVKSIAAYNFVRDLLMNHECAAKLQPPTKNYWEFYLGPLYKKLVKPYKMGIDPFIIGLKWETLCQHICSFYFDNVFTNHDGIRLKNNFIPDIAIGFPERDENGSVLHIEKIVECKKSLYFIGRFDDFNNEIIYKYLLHNETSNKYINYCDLLEFWVLENPDSFKAFDHSKVKLIFASDLLESSWLSYDFKLQIRALLEDCKNVRSKVPETIDELCFAIDQLLETPPPSTFSKTKKRKGAFAIRQYMLDGTFIKEYKSVQTAASEIGLQVDTITNVTSGRRNSAGGYLWRKCATGTPTGNIEPPNTALKLAGKIIFQVDQYGEVIATYNTIGQAERATGISRRSISDALKGIQKTAGGFRWTLGDATLGQ